MIKKRLMAAACLLFFVACPVGCSTISGSLTDPGKTMTDTKNQEEENQKKVCLGDPHYAKVNADICDKYTKKKTENPQ
jgi:hypothetical protein